MPVAANKSKRFQKYEGRVRLHTGIETRVKEVLRPEYPWRMFRTLDLQQRGRAGCKRRVPNEARRPGLPQAITISENEISSFLS